ncbi:hypothetical protein GR11A_00025 [Vibrio phage vB_VcorM_GR11A]|nr:hypothetical protein GR11A_00025 [Vibrio phage vB_VcorM_GR11A]
MGNIVKEVAARVASRLDMDVASVETAQSYQELFDSILKKYGVTSPNQLPESKKIQFFNEVDKSWNTDKEPGEDGPTTATTEETAGNVRYNKGEKVLVNKGKSWKKPSFVVGEVTRVGDKVALKYADGKTESFKPTKSGIGIIGRWSGPMEDNVVPITAVHEYLDASCDYYGIPFGEKNDNPFFPSNRPHQTLQLGGEDNNSDVEQSGPKSDPDGDGDPCHKGYDQYGMKPGEDGKPVPNCIPDPSEKASEEASVSLRMECPDCGLKQKWPSTGYCPSCAHYFGWPHANPEGYYTGKNVSLSSAMSEMDERYKELTGTILGFLRGHETMSGQYSVEDLERAAKGFATSMIVGDPHSEWLNAALKNSILNHQSSDMEVEGEAQFNPNVMLQPMGKGQFFGYQPNQRAGGVNRQFLQQQQRPMKEWALSAAELEERVMAMMDDSVPLIARMQEKLVDMRRCQDVMTAEDYAGLQDAYGIINDVCQRALMRKTRRPE